MQVPNRLNDKRRYPWRQVEQGNKRLVWAVVRRLVTSLDRFDSPKVRAIFGAEDAAGRPFANDTGGILTAGSNQELPANFKNRDIAILQMVHYRVGLMVRSQRIPGGLIRSQPDQEFGDEVLTKADNLLTSHGRIDGMLRQVDWRWSPASAGAAAWLRSGGTR